MRSDLPCTVHIAAGTTTSVAVPFADAVDAYQFVHAQARAATASGATHLAATIIRSDGHILADIDITSADLCGATRHALSANDDSGLAYARVDGIDALIYAHRSCIGDAVLFIGVDADDDQRILFAVNDADLLDTTVGAPVGVVMPSTQPVSGTVA